MHSTSLSRLQRVGWRGTDQPAGSRARSMAAHPRQMGQRRSWVRAEIGSVIFTSLVINGRKA